jgi:RHS repeat-associated protein
MSAARLFRPAALLLPIAVTASFVTVLGAAPAHAAAQKAVAFAAAGAVHHAVVRADTPAPTASHARGGALAAGVGAGQPLPSLVGAATTSSEPNEVVIPTAAPIGGSGATAANRAGVQPAVVTTGAVTYPAPASIPLPDASSGTPSFVVYPSAAYDSARDVDVEFGGTTNAGGGSRNNQTWTWDGQRWSLKSPTTSPSARQAASMAFDTATGTAILFGGFDGTSTLGDTWSWDGTNWSHLSPATSPPARDLASMAYDSALGKIVLFGGYNGSTDLADTWTWNGTTWTSVTTPSALTARTDAGFAYDATATNLVLYGGESGSGATYYGDTWLYGASGWVQATPTHYPGLRAGQGMAYDPVLGRVLLVGGDDASMTYNDQWLWNGTDWEKGNAPNYEGWRSDYAFVTAAGGKGQIFGNGGTDDDGTTYSKGYVLDWGQLGTPKASTFETHAISDRAKYGVNIDNGNVVVSTNDLTVTGPGPALELARVENSLEGYRGWVGYSSELTNSFDTWWGAEPDGSIVINGLRGKADLLFFKKSGPTFTAPGGADATLATSGSGYTLTMNSSSEKLTFNSAGHLTSDADRNGNAITYTWSGGQPASITDTAGRTYTVTLTGGFITTITDPASRTVQYTQSFDDWLAQVTDAAGAQINYDHNGATALFDAIYDPNNNETDFAYNGDDQLQTLTYPQASPNTQTYAYAYSTTTGYARRTTSTDPSAHATKYERDYSGQKRQTTDALGHIRSSTYSSNSDVQTSTDANGAGNVTTFGYDALNNPTTAALPTGATQNAYYAASANCSTTDSTHPYLPKCSTDAQGNKATGSYDSPGNLTQAKNVTTGATLLYSYNPATPTCGGKVGQMCSSTDGNSHTTSYSYDSQGNLTTITPPSPLGGISQTFDTVGRLSTITDGKSQKTTYSYDGDNRILQELTGGATTCSYTAGTCATFTYDSDGNLLTQHDKTGTTTYTYDTRSRQTNKQLPSSANLSQTYDSAGNVATNTDAAGTTAYAYNAANQLTSLAEPGGSCTGTISLCTTFTYDNDGNRLTTTYPGSTVMTSTLDNSNRPTEVKTVHGATVIADFKYTYTKAGSDSEVTQTRTDTGGLVTTYGYDSTNQLTSAIEKNGATVTAAWLYCYDNAGNRTGQSTATSSGAGCTTAPTTSYTYNAANELTALNGSSTGWSYDANGNETAGDNGTTPRTAEVYTPSNQLSSITTGGTATALGYAGLSNTERVSSGSTTFQNGPEGLASQTSPGLNWIRDVQGTLISEISGGSHYYYVYDGRSNVIALIDSGGTVANTYSYEPYGKARTATGTLTNPYQYASGYKDNTGLYHLGARYYDFRIGRFSQQDPAGQGSNLYGYAGNNPIDSADPAGALSFSLSGQVCFGVCISGSLNFDPISGNVGISGSLGLGTPGISGGFSGSTSSVGTGLSGNVTSTCSLGPASVSYDYVSGEAAGSVGTQVSSGDCSTTAGASYGFGSIY